MTKTLLQKINEEWVGNGRILLVKRCFYEPELIKQHFNFVKEFGDMMIYEHDKRKYIFEEGKDGKFVYQGRAN